MRYGLFFSFVLLLLSVVEVAAQSSSYDEFNDEAKSPQGVLVDFSYGAHLPLADFSENYDYLFSLAGKAQFIFSNNLSIGLVGDYWFADAIATDVVANLREEEGLIIDRFGELTDVQQGMRGFFLGAGVSYLIPVLKNYKRSGIEVRFEGGYVQHWIRFRTVGGQVAGLAGDYTRGYDRMTSGVAFRQYIGYRHLARNRLFNFFGGFDFMEAFTRNRRGFNFDTGKVDTKNRLDLLVGIRVGLTLPIYIYSTETQQGTRFY